MLTDAIAAKDALLHAFPRLRVLVVGDVMLDRYLWGAAERISPEAPVPVVKLDRRSVALGGAANVANNLAHLGVQVELAGLVGADADADEMRALCAERGIGSTGLTAVAGFCTITKTRVFAGHQQMVRIDEERLPDSTGPLLDHVRGMMAAHRFDAVVFSDYAKGVGAPDFVQSLMRTAREAGVPVYVDPKGVDYEKYRGAAMVKPNKAEMALVATKHGWPSGEEGAEQLRRHLGLEFVVLTLGGQGMTLVREGSPYGVGARAREVYDVSGAGDTVIATLVAGMAAGLSSENAVDLSNLAAAIVVGQLGSTPIRKEDLLLAIQQEGRGESRRKHFGLDDLPALLGAWRAKGQRVALTNGCFDVLHAGHVHLLNEAASAADRLVVAINSDASVTRLKGQGRPVMSEAQRIAVLSALEAVDAIVVYGEDTPEQVIEAVRPDVLAKGSDYEEEAIIGAEFVRSYGGEVLRIPILSGADSDAIAATVLSLT